MKRIILLLFISISCSSKSQMPFDIELNRLDQTILRADEYVSIKEQKISTIENMLHSRGVSALQQYNIYGELFKEYEAFRFDNAKDALDHQIGIASAMGDNSLKADAIINKATLLTTAGYYHEAELTYKQIDTAKLKPCQKVNWYISRQKFLYDYNEYLSASHFEVPDLDKISYYRDQVLSMLPENSYFSRHIRVIQLIEKGLLEQAESLNSQLIASLDPSSREYAMQTYWQGLIVDLQGRIVDAIHWWTESAISDIKGAIKDNASLSTIAVKISDSYDIDRAFRYIRFSFDDAGFYNAKLRKVQIATAFPMIEKAYTISKTMHEKDRSKFLIIISSIALLLVCLCFLAISMYTKERNALKDVASKNSQLLHYTQSLEEARENLRRTNLDLAEANAAKEEYLGLFLSMCSGYLDKLRRGLSREQYEAELKYFYNTFDTSFLQLYPGFVESFNSLLKPEHRISLKDGELLNTELRIFALIKLGISQSSHIASLLRYSVNTIYNYRAQIKNAALKDRENFEDVVKLIGSKC